MQVLNLDFCTLTKLPPSLGQLTALTTLDVEGNLFLGDTFKEEGSLPLAPSFPPELSGLQLLRYLNLNSCGLMQVPSVSFCGCYRPCVRHSSWERALLSPVPGHSPCGPACGLCRAEVIRCFKRPDLAATRWWHQSSAAARVMSMQPWTCRW